MKIYFNVFMHSNKHLGGLCLGRVEALQSRRVLLNTLLSSVVFLLETVQSQTISLCHSKRMPYPTAVRRYNSAVASCSAFVSSADSHCEPSILTTNAGYPLVMQEISMQGPGRQSDSRIGSVRLGKVTACAAAAPACTRCRHTYINMYVIDNCQCCGVCVVYPAIHIWQEFRSLPSVYARLVGVGEAMTSIAMYKCSGKSIASKSFCMCFGNFVDCCCPNVDNCTKYKKYCIPPSKQKRLRLDKSKGKELCSTADKKNNIHSQFLTSKELETLREGYKIPNTERNTQWSMWSMCNFNGMHRSQVKRLLGRLTLLN